METKHKQHVLIGASLEFVAAMSTPLLPVTSEAISRHEVAGDVACAPDRLVPVTSKGADARLRPEAELVSVVNQSAHEGKQLFCDILLRPVDDKAMTRTLTCLQKYTLCHRGRVTSEPRT